MKKVRRTVAANLELPLFGQMRRAALVDVREQEDMRGAYQRWLMKAITSQLIVDGYWPLNDLDIPGVPAGPHTMHREMHPIRPLSRRPPPGSIEEAQEEVDRLRALETREGQHPPVASRVRKERMAHEEVLASRIEAARRRDYNLLQATEGRVMDEPEVGFDRLADERAAAQEPGEDII